MPWPHFMLTNIIGAFLWATFYGLAAYSLGRETEQLAGWLVFVSGCPDLHCCCRHLRRTA